MGDEGPFDMAVAQHIAERGLLLHPAAARDHCQSESAAFMEMLAGFGVEATVVSGLLLDGDDVWDWTARQFDPHAAVPLVTPWESWKHEWWNPTEGWFDPLNDPVSILFGIPTEQFGIGDTG